MKSIILLHGALGSQAQMYPFAEILSKTFEVHTLEFSGHGKKSNSNHAFSINSMAIELDEFITAKQIKNPNVFGYSMGGYVALYYTLLHPGKINKIITLATKFDWSPEIAEKETRQLDVEQLKDKVPDFVNILKQRHGDHWEDVVRKTANMMIELGTLKPLNEDALKKIQTDAMICLGDKDRMVSLIETEDAVKFLSNGILKIFADTPHPFEKLDYLKLASSIIEFIDSKRN